MNSAVHTYHTRATDLLIIAKLNQRSCEGMKTQEILFRKTSAIPNPSFGVFSLYKYPAKFIPQVPAFVMENYAKKGMRVFDPFAGFGTVGYTAKVYGLEYEIWDLNPLLEYFHSLCEIEPKPLDKSLMDKLKAHPQEFLPHA